jgi:exodeoxyribonuclease VII small subunit
LAKKRSKSKSSEPVSFEQSLEQLRQIVAQLENGNLSLSQSLEQYELGVANLKQCYAALNAAQRKIEMLVDLDEQGNLITTSFDNTASTQLAEGSRRKSRSRPPVEEVEQDDDEADDEEDEEMDDPNSLF